MSVKKKNKTYTIEYGELWVREDGNPEENVLFDFGQVIALFLMIALIMLLLKGVIW